MQTCYYEPDEKISESEEDKDDKTIPRKYLLRQILVCSGVWLSYFCYGLSFGAPTVFIPQLRQEANSSDAVTSEMASWLSSAFNYSGTVCVVLLATIARPFGRKLSFLVICITSLIAYILFYWSKTVTHILISEIVLGPLIACPTTVSMMVLTEYASPRYRGVFLTLKSAMFLWGIWVANAIGTFMHWKNIPLIAFTCSMYSLLTALIWPESPYWLASVGRLQDCAASHRWLKGRSRESEAELQVIIQSRQMHANDISLKCHQKIVRMITSKSFYKPILLSLSVLSMHQFSGKFACAMYSIDIIKRITGKESTAYTGMLILDGITVLGMYVGCVLSKFFKRRMLLLLSSTIGVILLFSISLYLYLIYFEVLFENTIVSILLLMCYSLAITVGPLTMSTAILGELIPVKYRSSSVLILGCYGNLLMGSILKVSPFVLNYVGVRGLFLFFAVIETILTIINYKVLPETKDKTLLEIQQGLLYGKESIKVNEVDKRGEN